MSKYILMVAFLACLGYASAANGGEPGWERGVIRFGAERQKIQNTHILNRPYRPFHVYGNTVRRMHYRGRALPGRRDSVRRTR
jgi:hypothetical protein